MNVLQLVEVCCGLVLVFVFLCYWSVVFCFGFLIVLVGYVEEIFIFVVLGLKFGEFWQVCEVLIGVVIDFDVYQCGFVGGECVGNCCIDFFDFGDVFVMSFEAFGCLVEFYGVVLFGFWCGGVCIEIGFVVCDFDILCVVYCGDYNERQVFVDGSFEFSDVEYY